MSWRFFSYEGDPMLACPATGEQKMDATFMAALDNAREIAGFPWRINSGYRSPAYNSRISTTGFRGPHTTGRAVDIAVSSSSERYRIIEACRAVGMSRFGVARTFVHVDDLTAADGFPENVIWLY